ILVLDSDEMLAARDARRLGEFVASDRVDGYKLIQRTYLPNANFVCATPNPKSYAEGSEFSDCIDIPVIRLFRNAERIRYVGRVHELVDPVFDARGVPYAASDLVIHHFGKVLDAERLEQKKQLYLDLGRSKATEHPQDALAHFELGVQLYELHQFSECVPCFQEAVRLNPAYDLAILYIAKALHSAGRSTEASRYFSDSLKRGPNNDKVLFEYANFIRDRGNLKAAMKMYQKAIVANPGHSLALFNMGVVCIQSGDPRRGMDLIERAIRLNPENARFHENLARFRLGESEWPRAEKLLRAYVERFPNASGALAALAEIRFKLRQYADAAELAGRALAVDPRHTGALLTGGNAQLRRGELDKAEASYGAFLSLEPANLDALMNLAAIAEIRRDRTAAQTLYLRILDAHPGQPEAIRRLAAGHSSNAADATVAEALDRACAAPPHDPQCLLLVGSVMERAGRMARAADLYREAARQNPAWTEMIRRRIEQLDLALI
ncbi:MAG TPA: tetratricopeptide repeat protein, partial [Terriglobia bacterium]|nr:tetratricopeptide repeat protein [Terriglobia bacterium]